MCSSDLLQGLRTVIYPVGDLPPARQWYADVLAQAPYFDEPFYVGIRCTNRVSRRSRSVAILPPWQKHRHGSAEWRSGRRAV